MIIILVKTVLLSTWLVECAVLDPALYLAPSPPLILGSDSISPGELWLQPFEARTERIVRDVAEVQKQDTTTEKPDAIESRMFWPRFNAPEPALGIHIPLTFSLSGTYGRVSSVPTGVIGNAYANVPTLGTSLIGKSAVASSSLFGNYGRSGLAGSSYGSYGSGAVRVYGNDNVAAWSGWGNGKWGHYGKG